MGDYGRHPADDEEFEDQPRGADEDEFEDVDADEEDLDEAEPGDEDIRAEDTTTTDRRFTAEVGSEGGSGGDIEVARDRPAPLTGSEATTTGKPDHNPSFPDRQKGPGY
ncbi:MAG TPA: hypothetical protein VK911_13610 [Vicinamibacterales bacterium]|nr:hypothetical protein [Vicinamibacterales bacterium]